MFASRAYTHVLFALLFALLLPPHSAAALVDNKPRKGAVSAGDAIPTNNHPRGEAESAPSGSTIPLSFDSPFGSYPNLLKITQDERDSFSPVVFFPETMAKASNTSHNNTRNDILVKDHRQSSEELASAEDIERKRSQKRNKFRRLALFRRVLGRMGRSIPFFGASRGENQSNGWAIGKYDENRDGGMYESDLFDDLDNTIDGYGGRRTVHLGMDLGGPVGTPVHAFCDGIVHSVGYNPELGDYGHVIVVEHFWGKSDNTENHEKGSHPKRCWALYGHLDESTLTTTTAVSEDGDDKRGEKNAWRKFLPSAWRKTKRIVKPGDFVHKGQMIGKLGDIDENGGWIHSHLHFQLSTKPPDQPHDMPGASSVQDRVEALQQYPDPRYVLGPLY